MKLASIQLLFKSSPCVAKSPLPMNSNSWEIIDAGGDNHIKNHQQQRYGQNVKNYEYVIYIYITV